MTMTQLGIAAVTLLALAAGSRALAQEHPAMPAGMTHEQHLAQMKKDAELKARGARAMGFDQDTTTHHFRLTKSGGEIEVGVNVKSDAAGRDAIRAHLKAIAVAFANGDFEKPLMTHAEIPPGAATMTQRAGSIRYSFRTTGRGGIVRIETGDAAAREAVHEFLRYQIAEHHTGDRH
jgi:hypothetical protein